MRCKLVFINKIYLENSIGSEGREDNGIKPSENALVQGGYEKNKKFLRGGLHHMQKIGFYILIINDL